MGARGMGVWFPMVSATNRYYGRSGRYSCRLTHVTITRGDGLWVYPLAPIQLHTHGTDWIQDRATQLMGSIGLDTDSVKTGLLAH